MYSMKTASRKGTVAIPVEAADTAVPLLAYGLPPVSPCVYRTLVM